MDENKGVTCERDEERINEGIDEMDGYGMWEYMRERRGEE